MPAHRRNVFLQTLITNNYGAVTSSIVALRLLAWTRNSPANSTDFAYAVAVDGSGNVAVTGESDGDYYTAKYAVMNGALLWEKRYDGAVGGNDAAYALAVDSSGNVVVTGHSYNTTNSDYYTAKYAAADGALLWERRYNGAANRDDVALAVAVDSNGNVVVTGSSYNAINPDYFTAKYAAADGTLLWEKRYNGAANGDDSAFAVAVESNGNVVVTGHSSNANNWDYYTAKYAAADGALLWERRYNGPANGLDHTQSLALDGSGNVVVTGWSDGAGNNTDYYTAKYAAASGAPLWGIRYNSPLDSGDYARAVAVDSSGNVVVTGESDSDYYTAKYAAANGALLWEKRYNSPAAAAQDTAQAVAVDGNGNVVVTGFSQNGSPNFTIDSYTTAYRAADGAVLWEYRRAGNDAFASATDIALDAQGNVIVAGSSAGDYLTMKIQTATSEISSYNFTSIAFTNGSVQLEWTPAPGFFLQQTPSLTPPAWQIVQGSANTNRLAVPATGTSGFFRLIKP